MKNIIILTLFICLLSCTDRGVPKATVTFPESKENITASDTVLYSKTNSRTADEKNNKRQKTKHKNTNNTGNNTTSNSLYPSATSNSSTTPKVKKKRSHSRQSSYSGYCGAPTKKGGSCRRRVKGGGRCWQH